jgi:hypothetical protein
MNTLPCHTARTGPTLNADSCSKSEPGGGMAFRFFTRSARRLPTAGKAGATWGAPLYYSGMTPPRGNFEEGGMSV